MELNQPEAEAKKQIECSPDSAEVNLNLPLGVNFWLKILLPSGISYDRVIEENEKCQCKALVGWS